MSNDERVTFGMRAGGKQRTQAEIFNMVAEQFGKTTISQMHPDGGMLVWVTAKERDPVTALMSAALTLMIKRGMNPDAKSGISIRRMTVAAPGAEFYWQVTDGDGRLIDSGYAATEDEAAEQVAKHVKMHPASKS